MAGAMQQQHSAEALASLAVTAPHDLSAALWHQLLTQLLGQQGLIPSIQTEPLIMSPAAPEELFNRVLSSPVDSSVVSAVKHASEVQMSDEDLAAIVDDLSCENDVEFSDSWHAAVALATKPCHRIRAAQVMTRGCSSHLTASTLL